MIKVITSMLLVILIAFLLVCLRVLSLRPVCDKEKMRAFECGLDPSGPARIPFCMRFFLVGVIFLIFDVEVVLVIPIPFGGIFLVSFLFLLLSGLLYEWYYGGLNWLYVNWVDIWHFRGSFYRHLNCYMAHV